MPLAFSYVRFSSDKQELGDSLRRQVALAEQYAAQHNLTLDTHSYRDLGISAFKGRNAQAALGTFLSAVDSGIVPKGSYLLVENLDRLSRQQVDEALELFLSIIRRGIVIVTLQDNQVYSSERIKQDKGISIIISITYMMAAHEESAKKSARVKAAWLAKRERGEPSRRCPSWLAVNTAGTGYEVVPEQVKVIRKIFDLALAGNGMYLIYMWLNENKVPVLGNAVGGWTVQSVGRIIHHQAVIGRLVSPKNNAVFEDYYPAIIDKAVFFDVQEKVTARHRSTRGRKGENIANLFTGCCICGDCGSRMRFVRSASGGKNDKHINSYLHCLGAYHNKGCQAVRLNYDKLEETLLLVLLKKRSIGVGQHSSSMNDPRIEIRASIAEKEIAVEKLMDLIEASGDRESKNLLGRLRARETELEDLKTMLVKAVPPRATQEVWDEAMRAYEDHQQLLNTAGPGLREARMRLQSVITQFVAEIRLPSAINEYKREGKKVRRRMALVKFRGDWASVLMERNVRRKNEGTLGRYTEEDVAKAGDRPMKVTYEVPAIGNQGNVDLTGRKRVNGQFVK